MIEILFLLAMLIVFYILIGVALAAVSMRAFKRNVGTKDYDPVFLFVVMMITWPWMFFGSIDDE